MIVLLSVGAGWTLGVLTVIIFLLASGKLTCHDIRALREATKELTPQVSPPKLEGVGEGEDSITQSSSLLPDPDETQASKRRTMWGDV